MWTSKWGDWIFWRRHNLITKAFKSPGLSLAGMRDVAEEEMSEILSVKRARTAGRSEVEGPWVRTEEISRQLKAGLS